MKMMRWESRTSLDSCYCQLIPVKLLTVKTKPNKKTHNEITNRMETLFACALCIDYTVCIYIIIYNLNACTVCTHIHFENAVQMHLISIYCINPNLLFMMYVCVYSMDVCTVALGNCFFTGLRV